MEAKIYAQKMLKQLYKLYKGNYTEEQKKEQLKRHALIIIDDSIANPNKSLIHGNNEKTTIEFYKKVKKEIIKLTQ